jgi:hypothetical protein
MIKAVGGEMIELHENNMMWAAYAGAMPFEDGAAPLFAELALTVDQYEDAVLVLDYQDGSSVLTLNLSAADGTVMDTELCLGWASRTEAKRWAEENIHQDSTQKELERLGFVFSEC